MIDRLITGKFLELLEKFPVLTLTGPRQSGKTTLCREILSDFDYVTLESLDIRQEAINDPRGFLDKFQDGVILDEIQRAPDLPSYIQEYVDNDKRRKYVLTGSQQFKVADTVNQSLAGRTAVLRLLPFSYRELYSNAEVSPSISDLIYSGFYPRIHDQNINPTDALSAYVSTYVERDVRALANIRNISAFENFIKLCAANIGQLLDYTRFSNDIGVDQNTIKSWISILEASFICFRLKSHVSNYRKRITKSPKLYFYDVGLAAHLLGIREKSQVENHPLRGQLFENFVVADLLKSFWYQGDNRELYFYRESSGNEIDILFETASKNSIVEVKLTKTLTRDQFKGLDSYKKNYPKETERSYLVYGGEESEEKYGTTVLPRSQIARIAQ